MISSGIRRRKRVLKSPSLVINNSSRVWENLLCAFLYGLSFFGFHVFLCSALALNISSRFATIPFRGIVLGLSLLLAGLGLFGKIKIYVGWLWIPFTSFWFIYFLAILIDRNNP